MSGPALAATLRQCCLYACDARVGSPPASPAAGPHGAPLVGSVPSRLCRAVCLTQGAAAAARGRHRRCCREHCRRVRHHRLSSSPISPTPLAARRRPALPCPALAQTNQHTHTHTHIHTHIHTHNKALDVRNSEVNDRTSKCSKLQKTLSRNNLAARDWRALPPGTNQIRNLFLSPQANPWRGPAPFYPCL